MSKFNKKKLFVGFVIAISLVPSLNSMGSIAAEASSITDTEAISFDNIGSYSTAYEQLISLVDSNIEIVDNHITVNNEDIIQNFISNNVMNLQDEQNEYRNEQEIYNDILDSINNMNITAKSGDFTLESDGSIINIPVSNLPSGGFTTMGALGGGGGGARGGSNQVSTHWWGYRVTTFGVNGTRDLRTLFLNSAGVQAAFAAAFGLSPVALLAAIPIVSGAYHGMIANSLQNAIDTGRANNGITLDMTRAIPTYSVSPR